MAGVLRKFVDDVCTFRMLSFSSVGIHAILQKTYISVWINSI
jgi:hypothetical protein